MKDTKNGNLMANQLIHHKSRHRLINGFIHCNYKTIELFIEQLLPLNVRQSSELCVRPNRKP